jgi:F-type H+-transporting ATPase subunit a
MEEALKLNFTIFGLNEKGTMTVLMIILDMFIVALIVWLGSLGRKRRPGGPQNLVEWTVVYICNYADSIIGEKDAPRYYPLLVMLFLYIFVGNLIGLVPGLVSPTSSLSVTLTLAVGVWLYTWFEGLTRKGFVKFFAHYAGPSSVPIFIRIPLFFIELLSDFSRMISLSFRLFGNILAKEVLLTVLVSLILIFGPNAIESIKHADVLGSTINGLIFFIVAILRPLIIWLGVLVSLIQAGVFTLLTATYLAGAAVSHEEHTTEDEKHHINV